jgi:hypothetical protein
MSYIPRRFGVGVLLFVSLIFTAGRSEAAPIALTFDDLDAMVFGFRAPDTLAFTITNDTDVTWTDFHLTSNGPGGFTDSYSGPGTATYELPGGTVFFGVNITGLNVASGGTLTFSQGVFCAGEVCALGATGTARPTTDGTTGGGGGTTGVPEPSSLLLLACGAGIGLPLRRGKARGAKR